MDEQLNGRAEVIPIAEELGRRWRAWRDRTAMRSMGFTFYDDGTVEYRSPWGFKTRPRSLVLDATYSDGRMRKSVAGRGLAAVATHGLSLLASSNAGFVTVNIITTEWVETIDSKEGDLGKLYGLATQAKARTSAPRARAASPG